MTYSVGGPAYDRIISEFGEGVKGEGGEINRKALGAIVFADKVRNVWITSLRHTGSARFSLSPN